jgi:hypothetical protein
MKVFIYTFTFHEHKFVFKLMFVDIFFGNLRYAERFDFFKFLLTTKQKIQGLVEIEQGQCCTNRRLMSNVERSTQTQLLPLRIFYLDERNK